MSQPVKTFYILHGDDDFTLEQEITNLRSRMSGENADLNTSEFDGEQASVAEVLNAVSSYPFLADRRVVFVKGMLGWITRKGAGETGKKAVEQLLSALPNLPDWARLIFIEREMLPDSNKILKLAKELPGGYEKSFHLGGDSSNWIMRRAREVYESSIDPQAAAALATITGNDLRRADNELIKLVSYVNQERPITEDDVALLTPYVAEARLFDMVDALAEGRANAALHMLHRLLMEKDNDPFKLYGMIVRQFRLLLTVKEYLVAGGAPKQMAGALGMKPFVADKTARQARAFTLAQLEQIYRSLLDYDIRMKTGRIEPQLALDLLVAGLAK